MRGVVLRPYSHAYGFGCLRTLGKRTDGEISNRKTQRQNQRNATHNDAPANGILVEAHFVFS
jgi:hypothetical protein